MYMLKLLSQFSTKQYGFNTHFMTISNSTSMLNANSVNFDPLDLVQVQTCKWWLSNCEDEHFRNSIVHQDLDDIIDDWTI
jgi:hypothetical protein